MTNRKKRLKKGIESLEKQIKLHEEKKERDNGEGKIELEDYYGKELKILKTVKEKKRRFIREIK